DGADAEGRLGVVVADGARGLARRDGGADGGGEVDLERLVRLEGGVAVDRHGDRPAGHARGEGQGPAGRLVVVAGRGRRAVRGGVVDGDRAAAGVGEGHRKAERGRTGIPF